MGKNNMRTFGLLLGVVMLGSCAGGIVAPTGLNSRLLDITVKDTDSATILTLKTNNLPQYAAFKTKTPPSITIDLASTDSSAVSGGIRVDNGFVGKISVEQLGASTGYSSRIIIDLEKPLSYTTSADGNDIVVSVSKTAEQPAAVPSLEGTGTSSLQTGMELTPSAAPLGMEQSPTTSLEEAPLPGIGETVPSVAPEALAPLGMEQSPTTSPEAVPLVAAPLSGMGATTPSAAPGALVPLGMEQSPTTSPEVAPLAGMGETAQSVSPGALTPLGLEESPTTAPAEVPLAGAGETTPSAAPEALAPTAMEQSPTEVSVPAIPVETGTAPTTPSATGQSVSMENMQPAITPAPAPEAPAVTPAPVPAVVLPAVREGRHPRQQKIAMVVPAVPVTPSIRSIRIVRGTLVPPVPLVFKSNEAVLSKHAENGLQHVADYLNEHTHIKLLIQGYTDAYGQEAYNKELSYYRTLWVKMALERYGVPSSRLMIKPMGATKQFGHTKATEARNRRVVLSVVK